MTTVKYKQTKQLVRIAIKNGLTNKDIAEKSGLSGNSVAQVSRWRNGESLATERQMNFLINEFGAELKRKTEHLFYRFEKHESGKEIVQFFKVNGEVIFKFAVRIPEVVMRQLKQIAVMRVMVIQDGEKFHLLHQIRTGLSEEVRGSSFNPRVVHSDNESANWRVYEIQSNLTPEDLVKKIDEYSNVKLLTENNVAFKKFDSEALILKFSIRQAMLRHGYTHQDIVELKHE